MTDEQATQESTEELAENITLDDAVAALLQEEEEITGEPEDVGEEAEEAPQIPAIDPPASWTEAEKAEFMDLPPEVQQAVARRESDRDSHFQQQSAHIAQQRKQAEEALAEAAQKRDALLSQLETAQSIPEPDIAMLDPDSDSYNPDQYHLQKAKHDKAVKEQSEALGKLKEERDAELSAQANQWRSEQNVILQRELPELLDPKTGATFANTLAEYAQGLGITRDQLNMAAAHELIILNESRKYRELVAKARGTSKRMKKLPKTMRPGSSSGGSSTPKAQQLFDKAPTAENAVALLRERSSRGTAS